VPLTELQRAVAAVLRDYRSTSNFVGGGAVLNRNTSRISDDLDIYSDGQTLPQSVDSELEALRAAGYSVEIDVKNDLIVDAVVKSGVTETRIQWMDDPDASKRFFEAIYDDEFGFRLHDADNAVNKVWCAARRSDAARDAADLVTIVSEYAPLGPLVWAVCGKDESLTPPRVIQDIRKRAFGYADAQFVTIRTKDADPITRDKVRKVLTSALESAAAYCENLAPSEFIGRLFVDQNYVPVEATLDALEDKAAFAMPLRQFRAAPHFI
jgi:hypothetical protein